MTDGRKIVAKRRKHLRVDRVHPADQIVGAHGRSALPERRAAVEVDAPLSMRSAARCEPAAAHGTPGEPGEQIPRCPVPASTCRVLLLSRIQLRVRPCPEVIRRDPQLRRGACCRCWPHRSRLRVWFQTASPRYKGRLSTSRTELGAHAFGRPCCARGTARLRVEGLRDPGEAGAARAQVEDAPHDGRLGLVDRPLDVRALAVRSAHLDVVIAEYAPARDVPGGRLPPQSRRRSAPVLARAPVRRRTRSAGVILSVGESSVRCRSPR